MHLQPGRLPIGDILAVGWKLLQFSRRGEQRCRRDLTNDKHIEQTVVDPCMGSDLDTAARLIQSASALAGSRGIPHPVAKSLAVPSGTIPNMGRAASE